MVSKTSELLPEPDTPVNTVSRRFGSSTCKSLRLFTRAPCTRIRSWLSAMCSAGDLVFVLVAVLVAVLIVSPSFAWGCHRSLCPRAPTPYAGVGAGHVRDHGTGQRRSWI